MIIYNPQDTDLLKNRVGEASRILDKIEAKHCFITGSFLYAKNYKDIDIFVITRKKAKFLVKNKKAAVSVIDFNELHSLAYHSLAKCCVSKDILPKKTIRLTMSEYWSAVNEAIPSLMNEKTKPEKQIRTVVLYTEYLRNNKVLDSFELRQMTNKLRTKQEFYRYLEHSLPAAVHAWKKQGYIRRFFYTQAGNYRKFFEFSSQRHLYMLCHRILSYGRLGIV